MTEPHKRNHQPKYKTAYRINNWREYKQSLRDRGVITLWINPMTPTESGSLVRNR